MLPMYKSKLEVRAFINIKRAGLWKNQRVENLAMFKTKSKSLTTVFQRLREWRGRRTVSNDTGDSFCLRIFQSTFPDGIPGA